MIHIVRFTAVLASNLLTDIIDLDSEKAEMHSRNLVLNRKHPDLDEYEVLSHLRKKGLCDTANYLHTCL